MRELCLGPDGKPEKRGTPYQGITFPWPLALPGDDVSMASPVASDYACAGQFRAL